MAKLIVSTWKDVLTHWSLWLSNAISLLGTIYIGSEIFLQKQLPEHLFERLVLGMSILTAVSKFVSQDRFIAMAANLLTGLGLRAPPIPEQDPPLEPPL